MRLLPILALCVSCGRFGFDSTIEDANPAVDARTKDCASTPGVQRGTTTLAGATRFEVLIDPVDQACSFVLCERRTGSQSPRSRALCDLTSPSTLVIETGEADPSTIVHWQVVAAPRFQVQRGVLDIDQNEAMVTAAFSPVLRDSSFAIVTGFANEPGDDADERSVFSIAISDGQSLEVRRGATNVAARAAWQVVEVVGARVQHVGVPLEKDRLAFVGALDAVAQGRTFVVSSSELHTDNGGEEAVYLASSALTGSTSFRVERTVAPVPLTLQLQIVELPDDGSRTIRVPLATINAHDELLLQQTSDADPQRSFAFASVRLDSGANRAALSAASVTTQLTASSIVVERGGQSGDELIVEATIVELGP